jgi:hypothetical protein
MDSTTLNLLTRDGVVTVLIVPSLNSDHYAELYEIVRSIETAAQLRTAVMAACKKSGRTVSFG